LPSALKIPASGDPLAQTFGQPIEAAFHTFLRQADCGNSRNFPRSQALPVIKLEDEPVALLFRHLAGHFLELTQENVVFHRAVAALNAQGRIKVGVLQPCAAFDGIMHLEVVQGHGVSDCLEIAVNGILMPAYEVAQAPELFRAKLEVGFLDKVIHQRGRDCDPAAGCPRHHAGNEGLKPADKFLPCCSIPRSRALRNKFRSSKFTVFDQSGVQKILYCSTASCEQKCCSRFYPWFVARAMTPRQGRAGTRFPRIDCTCKEYLAIM